LRVILFGATGMVGHGVLLECLEDDTVEAVLAVSRRSCDVRHPKLKELIQEDLFGLGAVADELRGYDACFYCVGATSAGKSEAEYRRMTVELTVATLDVVVEQSPEVTICFVSGQGTDGSASGRVMWARVKGEAEHYVQGLPVESYMFRPGVIQPLKGVRSRTAMYQVLYTVFRPITPVLKRLFPDHVTTSVVVGRAMLRAVTEGYPRRILETRDINALGAE
jgi:uncharacterized protein YbjT (DUF2867 family)